MTDIPARPYPVTYRVVGTTIPLLATRNGDKSPAQFICVQVQHHQDNTIDLVPYVGHPGNHVAGAVSMSVAEYKSFGVAAMDDRAKAVWALELCGWQFVEQWADGCK